MAISFARAAFLYLFLIITVRLMGKRQVGQMEPSEFVVTMLMADLASIPMDDPSIPLYQGMIPLTAVLITELALSQLSQGSVGVRKVLCGKPVIIIENGKVLQRNLRKTRITPDELAGHLRIKGVLDLTTVQYAILETNGELSVFLWSKDRPATAKEAGIQARPEGLPVTLIENGRLLSANLAPAGKDRKWVQKILHTHNATIESTFLLTVDHRNQILWLPKDPAP